MFDRPKVAEQTSAHLDVIFNDVEDETHGFSDEENCVVQHDVQFSEDDINLHLLASENHNFAPHVQGDHLQNSSDQGTLNVPNMVDNRRHRHETELVQPPRNQDEKSEYNELMNEFNALMSEVSVPIQCILSFNL